MKKMILTFMLLLVIDVFAVTGSFHPTANGFVLSPGPASPFPDANDYNFGGSGSLSVSSPTAYAYDPNAGIDHLPKGEFVTLLKFDPNLCAGTTLSQMTLELAITNGNQSAMDIFNYLGGPGDFDLYWIDNNWQQGYGTPKIQASSEIGVTYTTLQTLLEQTNPVYLETLNYNALYTYAEGENWFTYELNLENDNYAGLLNAIQDGQTITFMLRASEESSVCFNLRAYIQNNSDGTVIYREEGPFLNVQTVLPFIDIDFDGSNTVDLTDLLYYMVDNWLETGENMIADIAPLGGDGIINLLDFSEFARHWLQSENN